MKDLFPLPLPPPPINRADFGLRGSISAQGYTPGPVANRKAVDLHIQSDASRLVVSDPGTASTYQGWPVPALAATAEVYGRIETGAVSCYASAALNDDHSSIHASEALTEYTLYWELWLELPKLLPKPEVTISTRVNGFINPPPGVGTVGVRLSVSSLGGRTKIDGGCQLIWVSRDKTVVEQITYADKATKFLRIGATGQSGTIVQSYPLGIGEALALAFNVQVWARSSGQPRLNMSTESITLTLPKGSRIVSRDAFLSGKGRIVYV